MFACPAFVCGLNKFDGPPGHLACYLSIRIPPKTHFSNSVATLWCCLADFSYSSCPRRQFFSCKPIESTFLANHEGEFKSIFHFKILYRESYKYISFNFFCIFFLLFMSLPCSINEIQKYKCYYYD